MRVRHYPLVTIMAGGALVIVPALAVWFSTWLRSAESGREVAAATPANQESVLEVSRALKEPAPAVTSPDPVLHESASVGAAPVETTGVDPLPADTTNFGGFVMADPPGSTANTTEIAPRIAALPSTSVIDSGAESLLNSTPIETPAMPDPVIASESLYDATKHPALAALPPSPAASRSHNNTNDQTGEPDSADVGSRERSKPKSSGRRSGRRGEQPRTTSAEAEHSTPEMASGNAADHVTADHVTDQAPVGKDLLPENLKEIPDDGIGNPFMIPREEPAKLDPNLVQDVVIQIPQENVPVGRVENLVAVTRATGWPVALVRSDLPDDVWWVQQMVGIQGNSFAARVNFGNEYSVSGTAYRMVIVFLDSQEEVRRFRIAKQFEQIPEGVRRSREYRYIRN